MKPKKNKNGFYVINKNFKCCPECGGTRFVYTCYVEWQDAYELENGKFILVEGQYGIGHNYMHPKIEIMTCENCGSKFINKAIERCSRNMLKDELLGG